MELTQLAAEIDDILRTMPPRATIRHELDENYAWFGRASAAVAAWNSGRAIAFNTSLQKLTGLMARNASEGLGEMLTILHQARHDLHMRTVGPLTTAVDGGKVFDYFDEVRKVVESAKSDLFFVDPYLDAEFVSRYLPHAPTGVTIRLMGSKRISTLVPAVQAFCGQFSVKVEVREASNFHDRYVLVDKTDCYQSGASFKDGAKTAPTTLTQIVDAFKAVQATYEGLWAAAKVHI